MNIWCFIHSWCNLVLEKKSTPYTTGLMILYWIYTHCPYYWTYMAQLFFLGLLCSYCPTSNLLSVSVVGNLCSKDRPNSEFWAKTQICQIYSNTTIYGKSRRKILQSRKIKFVCLFVWFLFFVVFFFCFCFFFKFHDISIFEGYSMPNSFLYK